jgi:hypothetical protein
MKINFAEHRILLIFTVICLLSAVSAIIAVYVFVNQSITPIAPVVEVPVTPDIFGETFVRTTILGQSVDKRPISVTTFGSGPKHLLLVGGIHGGYEWNTVVLAEQMVAHFTEFPEDVPDYMTVSIITVLNPDGLAVVTEGSTEAINQTMVTNWSNDGRGRFNSNNVDLNRNFACKWQPEATWRGNIISAGSEAFSEPEAKLLRDYVIKIEPTAVVFWHSIAGAVYASECENGILPTTLTLMDAYAKAASYAQVPVFDAYPVTGDAEGWLASIGIPAITVELETRTSPEWERNLAGTKALFTALRPVDFIPLKSE